MLGGECSKLRYTQMFMTKMEYWYNAIKMCKHGFCGRRRISVHKILTTYIYIYIHTHMGTQWLVEALCYKLEDHGINSRQCHWIFLWHCPSSHTMALGSTKPLTYMSTRNVFWGVEAAGQPYHLLVPTVMKSGSLKLLEPWGPVQACNGITFLYTYIYIYICACMYMYIYIYMYEAWKLWH
jgi:hypothetical protein